MVSLDTKAEHGARFLRLQDGNDEDNKYNDMVVESWKQQQKVLIKATHYTGQASLGTKL